jgi:hypothetical protein
MNDELRKLKRAILEARYTAEFNARYHDMLCRRYVWWDMATRVILSLCAVVAFAGMKLVGAEPWQTVSGITAMLATTVLPLLKWNKLIPRIEGEHQRWIGLTQEYENLWNDSNADGDWKEAAKELRRVRKRDNTVEKVGGIIPEHSGLLDKARRDVVMAHAKPHLCTLS